MKTSDLLEAVRPVPSAAKEPDSGTGTGLFLGELLALGVEGTAMVGVTTPHGVDVVMARTSSSVQPCHVGASVAVMLEAGDSERSFVIGVVKNGSARDLCTGARTGSIDLGALEMVARERIVFRCGKSSISLFKDGKVMIRGTKLLNRASGVNRILGGSVQIN